MLLDNVECCGCSACVLVCPEKAIEMGFNKYGFYSAFINNELCIECGKCKKVCPILNLKKSPLSSYNVYVAVANDKLILNKSSSGGIGYVLSEYAIQNNIPVCGVTYNSILSCANHVVVENSNDLNKIQGSKYLQSVTKDAFKRVISLKKGFIFGTPCQIAGLHNVLNKMGIREQFVLIDIFCHGVPSQLLWSNHLEYLKKKGYIQDDSYVSFRDKNKYILKIENYTAWFNEDAFYTFFLRNMLANRCCYSCMYRRDSYADLRIGDCAIKEFKSLEYSPSLVIANTQTGCKIITTINKIELHMLPFSVVNSIQKKDIERIPVNYEYLLSKLRDGVYPEVLIKNILIKGRIKALIKKILKLLIKTKRNNVSLKSLVEELKNNF